MIVYQVGYYHRCRGPFAYKFQFVTFASAIVKTKKINVDIFGSQHKNNPDCTFVVFLLLAYVHNTKGSPDKPSNFVVKDDHVVKLLCF